MKLIRYPAMFPTVIVVGLATNTARTAAPTMQTKKSARRRTGKNQVATNAMAALRANPAIQPAIRMISSNATIAR